MSPWTCFSAAHAGFVCCGFVFADHRVCPVHVYTICPCLHQTRDVVVYRLVTCGTVEEKIYRKQVGCAGAHLAAGCAWSGAVAWRASNRGFLQDDSLLCVPICQVRKAVRLSASKAANRTVHCKLDGPDDLRTSTTAPSCTPSSTCRCCAAASWEMCKRMLPGCLQL